MEERNCGHLKTLEWTLNNSKTTETRDPNNNKDEDFIFIPAQCKNQTVTLKYIFSEGSLFHVIDPEMNLTVQEFPHKCQKDEGPSGTESNANSLFIIAAAAGGGFVLIMMAALIFCMVRMTRSAKKKQEVEKVDDNPTYGLYAQDTQDEMPTESQVIDENDYYGTT